MVRQINTIYLHSQDRIRQMSENGPTGSSSSFKLLEWDQYTADGVGCCFVGVGDPDIKLI